MSPAPTAPSGTGAIRHDWTLAEGQGLFGRPLPDLVYRAQRIHRRHFPGHAVQLSTLLNIKAGGCPEDCAYCPQSARYQTDMEPGPLTSVAEVREAAARTKAAGATRFCMGAAWRQPTSRGLARVTEMVTAVKALGLETCATLGMLSAEQALLLKAAGLDYYNHNLDTSRRYYRDIITTRTYDDRLETLAHVRAAGLRVCCGGIIGMGEEREDVINLLITLANLPEHPESVPINVLVRVTGTPLASTPPPDPFEVVRTIALARILMPASYVRLSAGRTEMSDELQALCFIAGANSVFYGERLLTTANPDTGRDQWLLKRLGMTVEPVHTGHKAALPMSWLAPALVRRLATRAAGSRYRHRVVRETGPGAEVQIDGQRYIDFSSNDYLGLASHPRVVAAFQRGAERYGVGSAASALVSGYSRAHARLEEDLAVFTGRPRALVFSSGYLANLAVVTVLAGRRDTVIADRLNHASLIDGALLSHARLLRYPHRDTPALERRLQAAEGSRRLVVTESLFSMDGDVAPLGQIAALCERYHAALLVDDAHAIGVLGPGGQGSLAELGLGSEAVPVQIGTFGKALGGLGAFVAGSDDLIETMIQDARSYRYTTALAPAVAEAVREALVLARTESWRREHLRSLIAAFRGGLSEIGIPKSDPRSPIQALVFGGDDSALEAAERLRRYGLFVAAIRPPTVPIGSARLRVSLTAAHTEGQVTRLVEALAELRFGAGPTVLL